MLFRKTPRPPYVLLRGPEGFALPCRVAASFTERLRGLLGTGCGSYCEKGVVLANCASIHTNGMAYPIDVAFLDVNIGCAGGACGEGDVRAVTAARVLASHRGVEPGRVLTCPGARATVEREACAGSSWPKTGDTILCSLYACIESDPDGLDTVQDEDST